MSSSKFLLLIGVALIVVLLLELRAPIDRSAKPEQVDRGAGDSFANESAFNLPPLDQFQEFIARPLFSPNRRPAQQRTASAVEREDSTPADTLHDLNLTAIAIDSNQRLAVIHDLSNDRRYKVRVGELVSGWEVSSIHPDRVVLQHEQELEELMLRDAPFGEGDRER